MILECRVTLCCKTLDKGIRHCPLRLTVSANRIGDMENQVNCRRVGLTHVSRDPLALAPWIANMDACQSEHHERRPDH
jgi:hypothetical protein